ALMRFRILKLEPLREVYELLDHTCLNEVPGLETATCEIICHWLWQRLAACPAGIRAIAVQETHSARCTYYGE
ncbi:MAG TPA: 6-carboxytetrahydropterin synthase, partial [Candidatus Hydrogenedentes bacterium]|nr:6-carboxytetrahydropterin synthase [Candidatus Hydrogenedentota bacterium]